MINVIFKNEYSFHSEWDELTPNEGLKIFSLLRQLENGEKKLDIVQAEFFMYLAGISIPKEKREGAFWDNVFQASSMLRFFFSYHYNDDRFKNLSPETKELLKKHLPIELEETPEIRVAAKMQPGFKIDCVFGKNLIPHIKLGRKLIDGYTFTSDNGFIKTSLTAQQYSEAVAVANKFATDQNILVLDTLLEILYNIDTGNIKQVNRLSRLDINIKYAIWRNFRAICDWIAQCTHFSIIWAGTPDDKKKTNEAIGQMINSVSKAGYGSPDQIGDMNLMKLLEIMKQIIIDNLREMKAAKMPLIEIANKSGLPLELITPYL